MFLHQCHLSFLNVSLLQQNIMAIFEIKFFNVSFRHFELVKEIGKKENVISNLEGKVRTGDSKLS